MYGRPRELSNWGLLFEEPTHCRVSNTYVRCFPTMIRWTTHDLGGGYPRHGGQGARCAGTHPCGAADPSCRAACWRFTRSASIEIRRLVVLGVVSRREVAGASLVKLERMNAAALALLALADARSTAISRLSELAKSIEPAPASLALFGSFARGTDDAESDLDVLAVRSDDVEPDDPSWLDSFGNWQDLARVVVGNPVNVIETSRHELSALARTRSFGGPSSMTPSRSLVRSPRRSSLRWGIGPQSFPRLSRVRRPAGSRVASQRCTPPSQSRGAATARVVRRRPPSEQRLCRSAMPVVRKATASTPKRTRRAGDSTPGPDDTRAVPF